MNIKDFKWTEKRFGTRFANILKKLGGLSKDGTDGSIEYKDEQGNVTKLVTDSNFSSLLAKNGLIEVKWQELKDKRDNGELIPGVLYRITDYNCTTTQENTRSAGHQFDIVLLALSENKLAEEGWAMEHPTDVYEVTFSDGITKKCYMIDQMGDYSSCILVDVTTLLGEYDVYCSDSVDETNKTIIFEAEDEVYSDILINEGITYNYFQNSNLSAWKVWYCLDNDTSRFAWADDSVDEGSIATISLVLNNQLFIFTRSNKNDDIVNDINYYAWHTEEYGGTIMYTLREEPSIGDAVYRIAKTTPIKITSMATVTSYTPAQEGTGLPNGRGVIYRLIDEWNNDVGYDFKNIQFVRKLTDGEYDPNGEDTWCYTFAWNFDGVIVDGTIPDNNGNTWANYNKVNILYVNLLPNHVFISGTYNCYIDVNSFSCTIINGKSVILHNCGELVHVDGNEQSAIYLNNMKVLTES